MAVSSTVKLTVLATVGVALCTVGIIMYAVLPKIINYKVYETVRLVNGTYLYQLWEEVPFSIYMHFYFFNVTNADKVLSNNTVKPVLQQLGPYTYREYRKKENISIDHENGTARYHQAKWYVFEPSMSKGSLEDLVTTINIPLMAVGAETLFRRQLNVFERLVMNNMIKKFNVTVFVTKTVDEFIFKGYKDEFIAYLSEKAKREALPNGMFGFYYNKNYTNYEEAMYVVGTGTAPTYNYLQILSWNGSSSLPYWNNTFCNTINGTDGTSFLPFVKREDRLYMYTPDMCRSVYAVYSHDIKMLGLDAYRFIIPGSIFAATEENECFCVNKKNCYPSGMLDLSVCKKGAPVTLSLPHFYTADPTYLDAVVGLNPNKEEHYSFIDIQPMIGGVLRAAARIQLNTVIRPNPHIKLLKNLPKLVLPIAWLDESGEVGSEGIDYLKANLFRLLTLADALMYGCIGLGSFILVLVAILIRSSSRKKKHVPSSSFKLILKEKPTMYPQIPEQEGTETLLKDIRT